MANQQRSLDERMSWLGGIIDGEGTVTVLKRSDTRWGGRQYGYIPRLSVVNTDWAIIREVIDIFEACNFPHYVQTKKARKAHWKVKLEVVVTGIKRCQTVLPAVIPFLVGKKMKAENVLAFCNRRLSLPRHHPYTDDDLHLVRSIRETPDTPNGSSVLI